MTGNNLPRNRRIFGEFVSAAETGTMIPLCNAAAVGNLHVRDARTFLENSAGAEIATP